jgi:predicted GH43/DUF377 family glycosyl hydrolase
MNAGAVKYDGHYILLVRVEDMRGRSLFVAARSQDGVHFTLNSHSMMSPANDGPFALFEGRGVEDPRITRIDGTFYIVYTANSSYGTRLGIARTDDFESVERVALISEPDNKNGALFPQKINGRYARLERPRDGGNIWISYSDDLIYWGSGVPVLTPRGSGYWDSNRVGCAAPPIRIDEGWLLTYYGVKGTSAGPIFRLGAAVLDGNEPHKVLKRTSVPLLTPREDYERVGDVGNVVFCCGAVLEDDGELKVYYGAANEAICLGSAQLDEILEQCLPGGGAY